MCGLYRPLQRSPRNKMFSSVSSSSFCFTFFILRVGRLCNILRSLYRRVLGYEAERILCHSLIAPRHMCNIFGLSSFQRKLHINLTTNPSVININVANCHILLSFEMAVGLTLSSFFFEESTILQYRLETCKPVALFLKCIVGLFKYMVHEWK